MSDDKTVQDKINLTESKNVILDQMLNDFSKFIDAVRSKHVDENYFTRLKTNEERIRYCLENKEVQEAFDLLIKDISSFEDAKNDEKAKNYRLEGNKLFKLRKNEEALNCYSMALLCAPFDRFNQEKSSPEFSFAFANRSAVLFRLKKFKQCLVSIDYAIQFGYPSNQLHTLLLRKALCFKALQDEDSAQATLEQALKQIEDSSDQEKDKSKSTATFSETQNIENKSKDTKTFIQNTFNDFNFQSVEKLEENYFKCLNSQVDENENLSSANNFVKLCSSSKKGRHLKVVKNVDKDETLIVEKPFASILNPQFNTQFCHHCCTLLKYNLFPCPSCSLVHFCSQACSQEAFELYHEYECQNLNFLYSTGNIRLALRIILTAKVKNAISIAKNYSPNIDKKSQLNNYTSILNLMSHSESFSLVILSRQTLAACFYLYFLSQRMKLIDLSDCDYYYLGGLLLKHIQQISINSVVIFYQPLLPGPYELIGVDVKNEIVARGIYSTFSLVNHSCVPNSEALFDGFKMTLKAIQPISAGETITFSYGPLYYKMSRIERLETLKSQFYFDCDCKACLIPKDCFSSISFLSADALLCSKCKGPFIVNINYDGFCLKCKSTEINSEEISNYISNGKKFLGYGKGFINMGKLYEGEKQFQKSLQCFSRACFRDNRIFLSVYSELFQSHTVMESFDTAKKYGEECRRIRKEIFGEDSLFFMVSILQLINLKWTQQKKALEKASGASNRFVSINKKLIRKLNEETEFVINRTKKVLENYEIGKKYLLLDSSAVTCLKEMVKLEKMQISMNKEASSDHN